MIRTLTPKYSKTLQLLKKKVGKSTTTYKIESREINNVGTTTEKVGKSTDNRGKSTTRRDVRTSRDITNDLTIKLVVVYANIISYNIARVLPYLIAIGVIMVYFSTYARPCVHLMTCATCRQTRVSVA